MQYPPSYSPEKLAALAAMLATLPDTELLALVDDVKHKPPEGRQLLAEELRKRVSPKPPEIMNENIKKLYPDACKQWAEFSSRALTTFRDAYSFFDEKQIVVAPTFMQGEAKPWGYEVQTLNRFMREQANFTSRISAEKAGFEQAFSELQKLILAGNA